MGLELIKSPLYLVVQKQDFAEFPDGRIEFETPPRHIMQERDGATHVVFFTTYENALAYVNHHREDHGPLMVMGFTREQLSDRLLDAIRSGVERYILDWGWPEEASGLIDDLLRYLQPPRNN